MDDPRENHLDSDGPTQRNYSEQLQTHNVPTDDVENTNDTN